MKNVISSLNLPNILGMSSSSRRQQSELIRAADAARDRKDWPLAASLFRKVLDTQPDHHGVAIQLGHMLKEMGELDGADRYYQSVLAHKPDSDDLHLQIGHLRKLQGDWGGALHHYKKSFEINPANPDAAIEYQIVKKKLSDIAAHHNSSESASNEINAAGSIVKTLPAALPGVGPSNINPQELRNAGDRARDAKSWASASRSYRAFLEHEPADAAIWVQLGHCLKEDGDLAGGEAAYRRALDQTPDDADLYLQIGHVLKLRGQNIAALEAYRKSYALKPLRATVLELRALDNDFDPSAGHGLKARSDTFIFIEVSDLLEVLSKQDTVSGIQRVQLGLVSYILANQITGGSNLRFVAWLGGDLWVLPFDCISAIIEGVRSPGTPSGLRQRQYIRDAWAKSVFVCVASGDILIETGAIWLQSDLAGARQRLKHAGVRIGASVYDFIPLTHPEYCHTYLTERFSYAISGALLHLDFAITISDFTSAEMNRLLSQGNYPPIPNRSVKLAQEAITIVVSTWTPAIAELQDVEYILCVGTLHAHKNHIMLLHIWRSLIQQGIEPPVLVLVGTTGYGVGDLLSQLEATDYFDDRIKIIGGLTDPELALLYANCKFTIFPSIIEGWGLPVGESLAYGKVCVASNSTAIPEVGRDLPIYIDPFDLRAATNTIAELLKNSNLLAQAEAKIRREFRPRSWAEYGEEFLRVGTELGRGAATSLMELSAGDIVRPRQKATAWRYGRSLPSREAFVRRALDQLVLNKGWHPAETWGSWMDGREAHIVFLADVAPHAIIRVVLQCRTLPWPRRNRLTILSSCGSKRSMSVPASSKHDFIIWLDCNVQEDRLVKLTLVLDGSTMVAADPRKLGVGLVRLLYLVSDRNFETLPSSVLVRPSVETDVAGNAIVPRDLEAFRLAIRRCSLLSDGWQPVESWGAWMDSPDANVSFVTDSVSGSAVRVVLRIRSALGMGGSFLTATSHCGATATLQLMDGDGERLLWLDCEVGDDRSLSIDLSARGKTAHSVAGRIGLSGLAYGSRSDVAARVALSEALLFTPTEPAAKRAAAGLVRFTVTGHIKGSYSLASVNRRLALAIESTMPGDVRIEQVEGVPVRDLTQIPSRERAAIKTLAARPPHEDGSEVVISQHWPVLAPKQPGDLSLAYVFWEESLLPRDMTERLNSGFQGVLASSVSVAKSIVDSGVQIPVRVIGFSPDLEKFVEVAEIRSVRRRERPTAISPFTFLHVSSCFPRKGVDVLLSAFEKAFSRHDPVQLIIKGFPNPHNTVASLLAQMGAKNPEMPRVKLIDADLVPAAVLELYTTADVMVLPTRGEGYNIPAAEALAAGLPLITTGFGAHTDFATDATARLVDYAFASAQSHLSSSGSIWVEPDVDDLATSLQEAFKQAIRIASGDGVAEGERANRIARGRAVASELSDATPWINRIADVSRELLSAPPPAVPSIAWVTTWNVRCGVAEYSRMLLNQLPSAGQNLTIICDERTAVTDLTALHGWPVVPAWRLLDPRTVEALAHAIDETMATLVVIQHHPGLINWPELLTLLTDVRLTSRSTIVTLHNVRDLGACDPRVLPEVVAALATVSRVLVHTVKDLNLLKGHGLVKNVALFPQGADRRQFSPIPARLLLAQSSPVVGAYGFFLPHKGFEALIRAFALVKREWPNAKLRLVTAEYPAPISADELAKCRSLAVEMHLYDAIEWHTEYLDNAESLELLRDCDLVVLPYQETPESSSAAVRNAIASRAPVAVTPVAIFDDAGEAVLRFTDTTVEAIAAGVIWFLRDTGGRLAVQDRAGKWLEEHDWALLAARLSRLSVGLVASKLRS